MILYLDTSSLLKLYIEEAHCEAVRSWAEGAEALVTSRVALPEAMAALARRRREGDFDAETFEAIQQKLKSQWQDFGAVDLNEEAAGNLAVEHGLRGFDGIHLAAALDVLSEAGSAPVCFSSFDVKLNRAAKAAGLTVLDPEASAASDPEDSGEL